MRKTASMAMKTMVGGGLSGLPRRMQMVNERLMPIAIGGANAGLQGLLRNMKLIREIGKGLELKNVVPPVHLLIH